ncbi:MAG TPA: GGDEF domain-containing protein [Roseateles sp.]
MGQDPFNLRLLLLGIALTLAALMAQALLPARVLDLTAPNVASNFFLQTSGEPGAERAVEWVDAAQWHWRCKYTAGVKYQPCGLTFTLTTEDPTRGTDLRHYDSLDLELAYRGNAPAVRVALRDFDPRFSRAEDGNSARIASINLRTRDIQQPVNIELSELTVPEWWISQFNLPREYNRPRLDNVTALSIDVPAELVGQEQDLQLRRLALRGEWVSRETAYLAILCVWLMAASAAAGQRIWKLARRERRQQREIDVLTARTRQLRIEQDKLRRLATIDELTGVLNRRGLEGALEDFEAEGGGIALIVLDIDHFKHVNDRWGHAVGDEVLRRVAAIVVSNLRATDVIGRWGGEEFLVACRSRHLEDAARLAEKLRAGVQKGIVDAKGRFSVTASFGVALVPPGAPTRRGFKRADLALYVAKEAGRNRVEVDTAHDAATTL